MQIIIDNVKQFKTFFDVIYDMASELVELQLFPDRMVCSILDRSRTRFYHVEYKDEFFDEYIIDEVSSITVFVEDFHKLLKASNDKDTLIIEINDPYLVAKIVSENGNSRLFEFVLPTDFIDSPNPPHLDLPTICECDVGELKQAVKDIGLIGSDLFSFNVTDNGLVILTDKDLATRYANNIDVEFESSENGTSNFNLEYIGQMLKFDKISKTVMLKLGQDMPVLYAFKDELMGVTVSGMIAPKISEEE